MGLKDYQYILAIAKEKSISKAAQKLYLSQSTLSHALTKLEESLGVLLFDRSVIPLKLTYAGVIFVKTAERMLLEQENLLQQMQDISQFKKGQVTIGATHLAERYLLPMILPKIHRHYPGIELRIKSANLAALEEILLKQETDFTIFLPTHNALIENIPLYALDVLLALPAQHPLCQVIPETGAPYPFLDLKKLAAEEFILTPKGTYIRNQAVAACEQAGFKPKILLEVSSLDAAQAFVANGYGVSFILDVIIETIPQTGKIRYFRPLLPIEPQVFTLGYLKGKYLPKLAQEFLTVKKKGDGLK